MKNVTKGILVVLLILIVGVVILVKQGQKNQTSPEASVVMADNAYEENNTNLPRLLDLGAGKCVPCKMMAPILEELKEEYKNQFEVVFIDVWENPAEAQKYGIKLIPTQIFFDHKGNERFRHEGFFSREDILAKWKALGVDLMPVEKTSMTFSRWEPARPDNRPKEEICYLCDGDMDSKTRTVMKTKDGDVAFCSPHCYIITFASLTDENKSHRDNSVKDWSSDRFIPVTSAEYLYGMDEKGRPTIKAFSARDAASKELAFSSGNLLSWQQLLDKETSTLCGFCDRPVYPEDASIVRVEGMQTWGCCPMCALGVAARTGKDIEVIAKDALSGETIRVNTFQGYVSELAPATAVAWAGAKKDASGNIVSTGCFKQAFFTNESNLRRWVETHPLATGRLISVEQALAAKMKLTPEQISKACKIGECSPK